MKKKTILFAIVLATVANFGYSTYENYRAMSSASALVLENIEALSQAETTQCPDPYDVPDHFIEVKVESITAKCTSKGTISVCGTTFTGSYEKGKDYLFVLNIYNCSGLQTGTCCKQSDVRSELLSK